MRSDTFVVTGMVLGLGFAFFSATNHGEAQEPVTAQEKADQLEKSLTPEQRRMVDELVELRLAEVKKSGRGAPNVDAAFVRRQQLAQIASFPSEQLEAYWQQVPALILRWHRQIDPFYVTPDEKAAAAKLPEEARQEAKRLLSDDIETFLAARRAILARGVASKVLVGEQAKALDTHSDKRLRLAGVLGDLDDQAESERRARAVEEATKRVTELRDNGGVKATRVTFVLARSIGSRSRHPSVDPLSGLCYFNFPKADRTYDSAVSLQFANGLPTSLQLNMLGHQDSRISDLGVVDFASVKEAPAEKVTGKWNRTGEAKIGHVYIEHCYYPSDRVDMTVKFKVLDLKPGEWVIIEWEPIPQEGKATS